MLDTIKKMAAELLGISLTDVRKTREALTAEVATEDGRYAARTQLTHPEGSATPLNEAADRAQQTFAKIRAKVEAEAPKFMRLLVALDVAQQRRDESAAARDRHWAAEMTRRATGVHPKVDEFFRRLFGHGVTPHTIGQHRDEEVAIMADLHRWKADDPLYQNPDNPWRAIFTTYSNRVIAVPGGGRTVKRSVTGTPVRTKRYAADKWYMFNEIAAAIGTMQPSPMAAVANVQPAPSTAMPSTVAAVALPPAPIASITDEVDSPATTAPVTEPMTVEDHARATATAVFDNDPTKMGIYWPKEGVERGDFTTEKLIPALEQWVLSGAWSGAERFLEAARAGRASEFITEARRSGIEHFAARLIAKDERAMSDARRAGFMP